MSRSLSARAGSALVLLLTVALVVTGSPLIEPAAATVNRPAAATDAAPVGDVGDVEKPDSVSAKVTARASGHRVEDLSQRTEISQVFANPDGTWTAETASEPERTRDAAGLWHDIDTSLVEKDGGLAPRVAATDVVFSDGGDKTFAAVTEDGKDLKWQWPTTLPTPTIAGATATYPDVIPGGDLVVTATATGFTHSVVLRARPDAPIDISTPVLTDGATLSATPQGGLSIDTKAGDTVVSAPQPLMYDASTDAGGQPEVAPVDAAVGKTSTGTSEVTLSPDQQFLDDPDTTYPVTVDPSFTTWVSGDVWVQNADYTTGQSSSPELRAGTYDGGGHVARSFIHFDGGNSTWAGKHILSAKLILRNFYSGSCTGATIRAARILADWDGTKLTWGNQPDVTATGDADFSPAHGYSAACEPADATWDVKDIVQAWANGTSNFGIRLKAPDESSIYTWRKYRSANYDGGGSGLRPHINVTYNSYPGTAVQPSPSPATTWTPPGGSSTYYTSSTKPTMSSKATDPDGGTVRIYYEARSSASASATQLSSCTTGYVASGSTASCALGTALADNTTVSVRAKAFDGTDWAGTSQTATAGWSPWRKFVVASKVPAKPTIDCPGYADGSWTSDTPDSNVTCTISAAGSGASAPVRVHYSVNGAVEKVASITQSADPAVAKTTITISKSAGGYAISAYAESPSALHGAAQSYEFGYGQLGLAAPAAPAVDPLPVTTGNLALDASGPPTNAGSAVPDVKVQWRLASSGGDAATGWNTADSSSLSGWAVTNSATAGVHVTGRWDTTTATHDAYTDLDGGTGGTGGIDLDSRKPVMLDVQVCVTYPSGDQCTWSTNPRTIERVPHAFGDGFPTADVDAGQVALWTGEFQTDATDVTVPGFTDDLSLSRTASTYADAPTKAAGVFGPGWTANLDGPDAGLAGMQLIDGTRTDGTLTLVDGDGTAMVFGPHSGARRTSATLATGTWDALDEDSILDGTTATVTVTGSGASQMTKVTFKQADGTATTFDAAVEPTGTTDSEFAPAEVDEPGDAGITDYGYDTAGRVNRVWQAPAGISCPAGAPARGCRVLRLDYTPDEVPTVPVGDARGQVRGVWLDIYNPVKPGGAGMDSTQVAKYSYDSTGRLVSVTDPRSQLTTSYTYDGASSRLASVADPGLKPYQLEYAGANHKLARVKRDRPAGDQAGGTATLDTILYDIPMSGAGTGSGTGLPSLSAATVQDWGQSTAPTYAAAVFGPDKPVNTLDPAQIAAADWPYADLTYTDARGYAINNASNGAGGWQYTSTTYDDHGNITRQLSEGDINAITTGQIAAPNAGTTTVYNTDEKDAKDSVILPAGSVVTDTYGPVRQAVLADGSLAMVRPHVHTDYDQGAPNNGINTATGHAYALPTAETTTAEDPVTDQSLQTLAVHKTGYDPIVAGDTSGWTLGQATTMTTVLSGGQPDIVNRTRYDALGRVIETRQPLSTGADSGTRRSTYYQATGTATDTNCDGRPEWAGLPCITDYAAAPTIDGGVFGPTLPATRIDAYSMLLQPTRTIEASGSVTRTSTSIYLTDGRTDSQQTSVTGLASSTPMPGTKYSYDSATGMQSKLESIGSNGNLTGAPVSTGYDSWGRPISYSAAAGDAATTTYNAAGDVSQVVDNQGTTTWTYNGTDANGNAEYRGLPTKLTVSNSNGRAVEFNGGYDADGNLTTQTMPGGITQRTDYDMAGEPVGLNYAGDVNGQADQPWLSWSQDNDALGRVRLEVTPAGAAFDGDLTSGGAQGYSRIYGYDQASRLTNVINNTAPAGAGGFDEPNPVAAPVPSGTTCQTRSYRFDADGNRRTRTVTGANADGSCATSDGTTKTSNYDTADRLVGGYSYDSLGRATAIPGADTPAGAGAGDLSLSYYDEDSARTITQNGTTTTYSLDTAGRRSTATTAPTAGGPTTSTRVRHYADSSDNPSWETVSTSSGSSTSRNIQDLTGALGASLNVTTGTVHLGLTNPHGDSVCEVTVPTAANASSIDSWQELDEYGLPLSAADSGSTAEYGWLGGKQRAKDGSGLILMGARLYNPATGAFTSPDPVPGGNSTAYNYPEDPVNDADESGQSKYSGGASAIYKACRRFYGKFTCAGVVARSAEIAATASSLRMTPNQREAARHYCWNIYLVWRLGVTAATAITDAHEAGSKHPKDSERDQLNNMYSRAWYKRHTEYANHHIGRIFGGGDMEWFVKHGLSLYKRHYMYKLHWTGPHTAQVWSS